MAELVPDQSGFVEADGQRIYWERFGTGDRETICLLNGLAMHTKAWYGFVPMLTDEFDVLLWDYLGPGRVVVGGCAVRDSASLRLPDDDRRTRSASSGST